MMKIWISAGYIGCGLSEEVLGYALANMVVRGEIENSEKNSLRIYTKVGRVIIPRVYTDLDASSIDIEYSNIPYSPSCAFYFQSEEKKDEFRNRTPVLDYSFDGVMRSYRDSLARLKCSKIHGLRLHGMVIVIIVNLLH